MFDEIIAYLLNEDTTGYPIPENLDYPGYTLEAAIEDMLYDALRKARKDIKALIIDIINHLSIGDMSWQEIIEAMEEES